MTGLTKTKAILSTVLVVGITVIFCGGVVRAQDEPQEVPQPPPVQLLPDQLANPTETPAPSADISVGSLSAPSIDRIGLVDAISGGFPDTLWRQSELETLRKILPQLPSRLVSPAQRRLTKNLLLSAGPPPSSLDTAMNSIQRRAESSAVSPSQWLLETRVARLGMMGAWDDALAMTELVPPGDMTETLQRLRADAYLILGRTGEACGIAQAALNRATDVYWQKVQVLCRLTSGQTSAADLGLSLLREQQIDDAPYFWAADYAGGIDVAPPTSLETPTPLILAMLRVGQLPLPDDLIRRADATTLGLLAQLATPQRQMTDADESQGEENDLHRAAAEAQILLAEHAVALGTMRPNDLRVLYQRLDTDLSDDELASEDMSPADVRARVRLFQAALGETDPMARAELIARALEIARVDMGGTGPTLSTLSQVYLPLLRELSPSPEMAWFSGSAVRGFLAAGEVEAAREWLTLARSMARSSRDAARIADNLWPLQRLLTEGAKGRLPARALDRWAATVPEVAASQGREILLNLFSAFGDPVTISDWQPVLAGLRTMDRGPAVAPHIWNGLTLSARDRRVGEAVTFTLIAFGDEGPAFAAPQTLAKVIETLMAIGREQDARALAIEAALALGL